MPPIPPRNKAKIRVRGIFAMPSAPKVLTSDTKKLAVIARKTILSPNRA